MVSIQDQATCESLFGLHGRLLAAGSASDLADACEDHTRERAAAKFQQAKWTLRLRSTIPERLQLQRDGARDHVDESHLRHRRSVADPAVQGDDRTSTRRVIAAFEVTKPFERQATIVATWALNDARRDAALAAIARQRLGELLDETRHGAHRSASGAVRPLGPGGHDPLGDDAELRERLAAENALDRQHADAVSAEDARRAALERNLDRLADTLTPARRDVLDAIRGTPDASFGDLAAALGVRPNTFNQTAARVRKAAAAGGFDDVVEFLRRYGARGAGPPAEPAVVGHLDPPVRQTLERSDALTRAAIVKHYQRKADDDIAAWAQGRGHGRTTSHTIKQARRAFFAHWAADRHGEVNAVLDDICPTWR